MAVQEAPPVPGRRHDGPENTPRLRLKRKAPVSGYVDGAWWPHSDDLQQELPDLLNVLSVRLGSVTRVMYHLAEWAQAPRKAVVEGRVVRLDGYHRQPSNTIAVLDGGGNRIVLLVVPANTEADFAHTIAMAAATPGNVSTVDSLLSTGA
ncbi:DUF5994 family protein [Mycobacterium sp. 852002-51961_SCH5331710]|uniref:DUF5994 family protein n=1 Tax=Mycobacterium sp. 852002-51961_SCH5331710 TaxID=1834105 RepID=UPI0007FCC9FA|nr:DUF5994 family protein [Mycobacterium sp. 852002-51961_SCH5331710]OBB35868.1 hypothetical protein A5752_17475 [Mycobacterium sp. 852002-51961_SCH5331710]